MEEEQRERLESQSELQITGSRHIFSVKLGALRVSDGWIHASFNRASERVIFEIINSWGSAGLNATGNTCEEERSVGGE